MKFVTVYLTGKYAPSGQDWATGKLRYSDNAGVEVEDSRGNRTFYPYNRVERVSERTGW